MIKKIEHDLLDFEWGLEDLPDADELIVIMAKRMNQLISEHNDLIRTLNAMVFHPNDTDRRPKVEAYALWETLLKEKAE
jgi:hypothetical protein